MIVFDNCKAHQIWDLKSEITTFHGHKEESTPTGLTQNNYVQLFEASDQFLTASWIQGEIKTKMCTAYIANCYQIESISQCSSRQSCSSPPVQADAANRFLTVCRPVYRSRTKKAERFKHSLHSSCSSAVAAGLWKEVCRACEAKKHLTGGQTWCQWPCPPCWSWACGGWRPSCATSPSRRSATWHRSDPCGSFTYECEPELLGC